MNQFLPQAGTTGFAGSSGSAGSAGSNQGGFATAGSAGASAGTAGVGGNAGTAGSAGAAGSAGSAGMGGGAGAAGMAGAGGSAGSAGAAGSAGSGGAAGTGGSAGSGGSGGNAGSGGSAGAGGDGGNGGGAGAGNCETQCTALRAAIVHRYSFNGSGTLVEDSIGTADGTVVNTTLGGTGSVALAGGTSDQYVDLPNGIISALGDATFEMWIDLAGVGNYPRVFDFGSSSMGEDVQGSGVTYLFLYPGIEVAANDALNTRVTISTSGSGGETRLYQDLLGGLPFNTTAHVAVVIDDANDLMLLYVDGALKGSVAQTIQLSQLDDVNNWLGRSQFVNDDELQAEFFEFRIYSEALSLSELQFSFGEGPDATFLDP